MARQATKGKVTSYHQLDCRRLAREHGFTPGHSFVTSLLDGWGYPATQVEVSMHEGRLDVRVGDLVRQCWPVEVSRTSLAHRNAWRWWFACPSCTRRCAVLYFRGVTAPGCLVCMNLSYLSQSHGAMMRGIERNQRIYKRLKWNPGQPLTWCRPKGMWRRTLLALSGQLDSGYSRMREALDKLNLHHVTDGIAEISSAMSK